MLWPVYGILGGTFDPPHVAHLAAAHTAYEQLGLDDVRLMTAGDPWQKSDQVVADAHHRWSMTQLAAAEAAYLIADDTEIVRSGPTYTIDTLDGLGPDAVLILGTDSALTIPSWHRADELLARVSIAVVKRPTVSFDEVRDAIGDAFHALDMPTLDLSASQIRSHIADGRSPRFLVPDSVLSYIDANRLYRDDSA
jgi:nicotinate-nucleotide adenylyltransferase